MTRRALLLVNPKARQGSDQSGAAAERLRAAGFEVVEPDPADESGPTEKIRRYRDRADLIVIGGGDGSVNAAAAGLLEAGLPFGLLPLGTANDLARTLGLPTDLAAACAVIAAGHTRRVDVGLVNDRHFFNAASLGLSSKIAKKLTGGAKSRWGIFAYIATAVSVLFHARPFSAVIHCDGAVYRVKTVQITIGNGRHFGGGLTVAGDATIDDGLLDVYSLEVNHWWQLLPLLPSMKSGTIGAWPKVRALKVREVEIVTRRPRSVNTDGELTTKTPATFRVLPGALSIFVPADVNSPAPQ